MKLQTTIWTLDSG